MTLVQFVANAGLSRHREANMISPKTCILIRRRWKDPIWAVGLAFALGVLTGANLPSHNQFGRWDEAASAWLSRPKSQPVQKRELGPVKQRRLNRLTRFLLPPDPLPADLVLARPCGGAAGCAN